MIVDYRNTSSAGDLDTDICIIGSGVAGLAIARSFIGSDVRVCIVESGGWSGEEASQSLYAGSSRGTQDFDPGISRMRVFGGTCQLWGGGCVPMGQTGARDWVADSGWPIGFDVLRPYYTQAGSFCGIESQAFSETSFLSSPVSPVLQFDNGDVVNCICAFSPLLFGNAYRVEIARSQNVTVLLHATALELDSNPGGESVTSARIATLDGRRSSVHAKHFVLACGGIENARLLLLSDSRRPEGLGNRHDLVGRYFMDHPSGQIGVIRSPRPDLITRPYDHVAGKVQGRGFAEICLSDAAQQAYRSLAARVRPFAIEGTVPSGVRALRELKATLRMRRDGEAAMVESRLRSRRNGEPSTAACNAAMPGVSSILRQAVRVARGVGDLARAYVRIRRRRPTVEVDHIALVGYFEQAPNRDSRITLGSEIDALGQRKVCVDWRLTPLDSHTYRTASRVFGRTLARACGGVFIPAAWLADDAETTPDVYGTSHHLGTTRMSADPARGVVDLDCMVHGIDNLFIAGSSVFPTGGWAFPTFTIVALSLRLADHLRLRLQSQVA